MTSAPWQVQVFTLFPEMFPGPLGYSVVGRALEQKRWTLDTVQIRDFGEGRYKAVDDTPFGGGVGMVMRADVLGRAIESTSDKGPLVYLSPRGTPLNQNIVKNWVYSGHLRLLCGRYEGVDERFLQKYKVQEVSLGDFILSGGEIPALAVIDACVRLLPGVLGNQASIEDESFSHSLLEYPHYTKPQSWQGLEIPAILLTGHHNHIQKWRHRQSEYLTRLKRPDLWASYLRKVVFKKEENIEKTN